MMPSAMIDATMRGQIGQPAASMMDNTEVLPPSLVAKKA
jgi:hypothetical protein